MNWWLADVPETVFAAGGLRFYGGGQRRGPRPDAAADPLDGRSGRGHDPFALDLRRRRHAAELYLEAERDDGYLRDRDVFSRRYQHRGQRAVCWSPTAPARS